MPRSVTVLAAALVSLSVLGPASAGPATGALADDIMRRGGELPSAGNRGYVAVPAEAFTSSAGEVVSPIIFVNRCRGGCSFTKASLSDSISNQTIIGPLAQGTRFNLGEFAYSEQIWNETLACIRAVYQPFGVQVVTEDPGATAHHEAVLAGRSTEAGYPANTVLGVAPLDSSTCRPQNNVISFSFANDHGPSPLDMCWTVAQESAHAFGLDHAFECSDALTYLPIGQCPGAKQFRNLDSKCGEFSARNCICGGTTQNTYQRLIGVHGPGTVPVAAPVVDIRMPTDGATGLPAGFSVFPTAIDPRGLNHLELLINGWKWAEVPGSWQKTSIYTVNLPGGVPDGVMDITIRGCGDTGVCGADDITVTRGAPCNDAVADCAEGQKCEQGKCFWDPPTLAVGESCEYAQQCLSEVCANVDGADICSQNCVSGPNDRCPDGFECISPGLGQPGNCGPLAEESTGCCSVGNDDRGALAANLGLGLVIGLIVVRRRRRRAPRA